VQRVKTIVTTRSWFCRQSPVITYDTVAFSLLRCSIISILSHPHPDPSPLSFPPSLSSASLHLSQPGRGGSGLVRGFCIWVGRRRLAVNAGLILRLGWRRTASKAHMQSPYIRRCVVIAHYQLAARPPAVITTQTGLRHLSFYATIWCLLFDDDDLSLISVAPLGRNF